VSCRFATVVSGLVLGRGSAHLVAEAERQKALRKISDATASWWMTSYAGGSIHDRPHTFGTAGTHMDSRADDPSRCWNDEVLALISLRYPATARADGFSTSSASTTTAPGIRATG
jgi:hypothetical protein